ncbi:GFA family protein [Tsuneonella mangrovi]|uniref:GFA family protein n=1 Tax=Tsuneonella mangrovi TaxID=1982042 RepID=UPI000BA29B72|nr:GFA family protein [Tsuneonella mangrovi]
MTTPKTGGCLCGAVRYSFTGEPLMQAVCHCKNCQRQSGSGWSMLVGLPKAAVEIEGEVTTYTDHGTSGDEVYRQFCPTCGSPVFTRVPSQPDMIFIKAGTFDDTSDFAPQIQFWTASKQDWIELEGVPGVPGNPG